MRDDAPISRFRAAFPGVEPCAVVRSPGRVNLIGEHIDYNDGIVLPIAIDLETRVVIGRTNDGRIRVRTAAQSGELNYAVDSIPREPGREWDAYVRGVALQLAERGIRIHPCALWIESDIPQGAGLSSSAALEISVALALLAAAGQSLLMREIADLCREAEHRFAGVPCGIMDQYACALAREGHALAIDCRDKSIRHVPWPDSGVRVLVVDSRIRRRLADGAYAQRVDECRAALTAIQRVNPTIQSWRGVIGQDLAAAKADLTGKLMHRALHVITEIERAQAAPVEMAARIPSAVGRLIRGSHDSLRDLFEVSLPDLDAIVETLNACDGVMGARLTGAGFGGCVIALLDQKVIATVAARLAAAFPQLNTTPPAWFDTGPGSGASIVNL